MLLMIGRDQFQFMLGGDQLTAADEPYTPFRLVTHWGVPVLVGLGPFEWYWTRNRSQGPLPEPWFAIEPFEDGYVLWCGRTQHFFTDWRLVWRRHSSDHSPTDDNDKAC